MPQGGELNDQNRSDLGEATASASTPSAAASAEAVDLEAKLAELEAQIAQLKEDRLRALAEVENVRRRAARDRQDASQYAISNFARDTLVVADNLQRAMASVDPVARASDPVLETLMSGIEMTERGLLAVLERNGIKPIPAEGVLFDPHVHEAMFEIPNLTVPHGTVLQVLENGYLLHDRTLRPARVGISRGGPKLPPGAAVPDSAAATAAAADVVADPPAAAEAPVSEGSGTATADSAAPSADASEAGGPAAENIFDFTPRATATGERYQQPQEGEQRSGARVDETL